MITASMPEGFIRKWVAGGARRHGRQLRNEPNWVRVDRGDADASAPRSGSADVPTRERGNEGNPATGGSEMRWEADVSAPRSGSAGVPTRERGNEGNCAQGFAEREVRGASRWSDGGYETKPIVARRPGDENSNGKLDETYTKHGARRSLVPLGSSGTWCWMISSRDLRNFRDGRL